MADKSKEQIEKEEAQKAYLNGIKEYSYGAVAGKALADEDIRRAGTSLDKLVTEMFGKDERLDGILEGIYSSEDAVKTASQVYASKYQESLGKANVSSLWDFYGDLVDKYAGDLKSKASEEINKFGDMEFGKVRDNYLKAKEITESKTNNFSKDQKEKAKKDMQKYEKVMITMRTLEDAYLDKFDSNVTEESRKNNFKQMYGEKSEQAA